MNQMPEQSELDAPQRLSDALRAIERAPAVPAAVDEAVAGAARSHFARVRRRRLILRLTPAAAAAAAAIALAVMWPRSGPEPAQVEQPETRLLAAVPADVDASGRVDILDAFKLARHVAAGDTLSPAWDFTQDGLVDRRDADALARQAVRMERGT
jgi:hypothetical protein